MNPSFYIACAQLAAWLAGATGLALIIYVLRDLGLQDRYVPQTAQVIALVAGAAVPLFKIVAAHQAVTPAMWLTAFLVAVTVGIGAGGIHGHVIKPLGERGSLPQLLEGAPVASRVTILPEPLKERRKKSAASTRATPPETSAAKTT